MTERPLVRAARRLRHARRRLRPLPFPARPPLGMARFGAMHRPRPVSDDWGFDRGQPVDRWYVNDFYARFAGAEAYALGDIRGRVVEVGGDEYASKYAAPDRPGAPTSIDVLHVSAANPGATIVGDLTTGEGIPERAFDCVICAQTLHVLYDVHAAIASLHAALADGGVALVTVPGITRSCIPDRDHWGDFWRFTTQGAARAFEDVFGAGNVRVETYGNLLTAMGFLQGMAAEEFSDWELRLRDPDFEVIIGIRAQRPASA
jgi:SAM-dependent methyltransferase